MTRKRARVKKIRRNLPCPCGSGKKYKHCCEKQNSKSQTDFIDAFIELPNSNTTYLLDTCVWGEILKSEKVSQSFLSHFETNNLLAGVSVYSLFELSRATSLIQKLNALFLFGHYNIWIPLLYDQMFDLELSSYPNPPAMRWMPMSLIADEDQPDVMSKFTNDRRFLRKRDEHLEFGYDEFMSLEEFKENYPPDKDGNYSPEQAKDFCWCNAVDFLGRYFREFMFQFKDDASAFDSGKIPSIQMRSLLLFFKYYIYHQSPRKSDFMDFAIASYVPYVDIFVTEKNVINAMMHIKGNGVLPSETSFVHVNDFIEGIST